jgi:hypothetical protein
VSKLNDDRVEVSFTLRNEKRDHEKGQTKPRMTLKGSFFIIPNQCHLTQNIYTVYTPFYEPLCYENPTIMKQNSFPTSLSKIFPAHVKLLQCNKRLYFENFIVMSIFIRFNFMKTSFL